MKKLIILLVAILWLPMQAATTLVVEPLSGQERAWALAQIGYVRLNEDSVRVYAHDGTRLAANAIADVRKIVYSDAPHTPTALPETDAATCRIYPNPTAEQLHVDADGASALRVFDMSGRLVLSTGIVGGTATIDVSSLVQGTYLLMLDTEMMKFIKK